MEGGPMDENERNDKIDFSAFDELTPEGAESPEGGIADAGESGAETSESAPEPSAGRKTPEKRRRKAASSGGGARRVLGGFRPGQGQMKLPPWVILTLMQCGAAGLLLLLARFVKLPRPVWLAFSSAAAGIGLAPLVMRSLKFFFKGGHSEPVIMLSGAFLLAASGKFAAAVICAIIYNAAVTIFEGYSDREFRRITDALSKEAAGEDIRAHRLRNTLREASTGRISGAVRFTELDNKLLLAAIAVTVLFGGLVPLVAGREFSKWVPRAVTALLVCTAFFDSSIRMAYLRAIKVMFEGGVYPAGTNALSASSEISSIVFNKTGTLTVGRFEVVNMDPVRVTPEELLYLASYADAYSDHPIAQATLRRSGVEVDKSRIVRHQRGPGFGSIVQLDSGQVICAGNIELMERLGVKGDFLIGGDTSVFVSVGRTYVGRIDYEDTLRPEAVGAVSALRRSGVANIALMTGDNAISATSVGRKAGISEIYSDCQPSDKLARLQYILATQERGDRLAYVTSAGKDRELLELANLSVVLGTEEDITADFPDVVVDPGDLAKIPLFVAAAKDVRRSLVTNLAVTGAVRALMLILGLAGVMGPVPVVIIMQLLEFGAFLNTRVGGHAPQRDLKSILSSTRT